MTEASRSPTSPTCRPRAAPARTSRLGCSSRRQPALLLCGRPADASGQPQAARRRHHAPPEGEVLGQDQAPPRPQVGRVRRQRQQGQWQDDVRLDLRRPQDGEGPPRQPQVRQARHLHRHADRARPGWQLHGAAEGQDRSLSPVWRSIARAGRSTVSVAGHRVAVAGRRRRPRNSRCRPSVPIAVAGVPIRPTRRDDVPKTNKSTKYGEPARWLPPTPGENVVLAPAIVTLTTATTRGRPAVLPQARESPETAPHATLPRPIGEVPEWLNGRDWKSRNGGQPRSGVRIPPSPPLTAGFAVGA